MNSLTRSQEVSIKDNIKCHVCDTEKVKSVYLYNYNNKSSEILRCIECGHLFLYPVPLIDLSERTMNTISDAEFSGNVTLKFLHEHFVIGREIRNVRKFIQTPNPTLLDIGCGTGWTTAIWQKNGFSVTGLEPSRERSQVAKENYGLKVINAHIEECSIPEQFDVVILRHLLEHIENPTDILKKIKSFLKPEGLLVITMPNINCIGRYLFRESWQWVLPWHLHFYTPKTLARLIKRMGYENLQLYQIPSPLWYPDSINRALGGKIFKRGMPTVMSLILCAPIIFLGLILNLNDNMTLICRNSTCA